MSLAEQIVFFIAASAFVGTMLAHIIWAIIKGIIKLFRS